VRPTCGTYAVLRVNSGPRGRPLTKTCPDSRPTLLRADMMSIRVDCVELVGEEQGFNVVNEVGKAVQGQRECCPQVRVEWCGVAICKEDSMQRAWAARQQVCARGRRGTGSLTHLAGPRGSHECQHLSRLC
jgi:hypothetical protein